MQRLVQYYNCMVRYLDNENKHLIEHYTMYLIHQDVLICTNAQEWTNGDGVRLGRCIENGGFRLRMT